MIDETNNLKNHVQFIINITLIILKIEKKINYYEHIKKFKEFKHIFYLLSFYNNQSITYDRISMNG